MNKTISLKKFKWSYIDAWKLDTIIYKKSQPLKTVGEFWLLFLFERKFSNILVKKKIFQTVRTMEMEWHWQIIQCWVYD